MRRRIAMLVMLVVSAGPMVVEAAPETMSDGTVFDGEYYAENNPDVVAVLGTDVDMLYQHYQTFGKTEGRLPYAGADAIADTAMLLPDGTMFDAKYYAENNPDVVSALGTDADILYQHYQMFGKSEGRLPYAGETTDRDPSITYLDGIGEIYFKDITSDDDIVQNAEGLFCVRDQLLITAKHGVTKTEIKTLADQFGFEIVGMIAITDDYQIESKRSLSMEELQKVLDEIGTSELISYASYNYIWYW